ncbi:MAG TPA: cytochrome d ubiquinol oxidase subunit II [Candidatus Bathyarchaeia archaeon]|nr:cytochrome d ubiquinol oxidase subunit II [Candidatus Bathyarchaeia archaeon]
MESVPAYLWFALFNISLALFVILDGADLGVGALFLAAREPERSAMAEAIGPLWYANETWLVIAGTALFGAFPLAYSVILSALYIPVMMLIFGLMLRAVSVEFRNHSAHKAFWGAAFGAGSLLAILGLGCVFGGILGSPRVENGLYAGGPWDWLNVPSCLIAAGTAAACIMLGAASLVRTTEGAFLNRSWRLLQVAASVAAGLYVASLAVLPLARTQVADAWAEPPRVFLVPFFLLAGAFCLVMTLSNSLRRTNERAPLRWSAAVILSSWGAALAAAFPCFVPYSVSIAGAAAPRSSLLFMLIGAGAVYPVIIAYNVYIRAVFSAKVSGDEPRSKY